MNKATETGKDNLILPGEKVCTAEEYIAGSGTYEEGGVVRSAYIGRVIFDDVKHIVRVIPVNQPLILEPNMEVLVRIEEIKESGAIVEILRVIGQERKLTGPTDGMIHISNMANRYVKNIRDAYQPGDIALAKVVQTKPSIRLSTVAPPLGVIKVLCPQCREAMTATGLEMLECKECNLKVKRKISSEYGKPRVF